MITNSHAMFLESVLTSGPLSMSDVELCAVMISCARAGHVTWLQVDGDIYPAVTDDGRIALGAWKAMRGIEQMAVA